MSASATSNDPAQRPLRVAILGFGLAGTVFHAPLVSSTPGMEVSALVTGSPERQKQARAAYPDATVYATADDLWRDAANYDVAVIATPNRAHVPLALAAFEAGLAVVVDKPAAPSSAEAERLIAGSKSSGKALSIFQNRRWDGDFMTVKRLISEDMIGKVVRFESRFDRWRPAPNADAWRERPDPEEGGGLLFDLGSHLIDQAMQLFGKPISVYAEVAKRRPGAQIDDDTFVALRFEDETVAHLWMNVISRLLEPRFFLRGLRGSFEKYGLDPQEPAMKAGARPGDPGWGEDARETWGRLSTDLGGLHVEGAIETLLGAYEQFYAQFRDAVTTGAPVPVDPAESLAALRVIEAARQSAQDGTVIKL